MASKLSSNKFKISIYLFQWWLWSALLWPLNVSNIFVWVLKLTTNCRKIVQQQHCGLLPSTVTFPSILSSTLFSFLFLIRLFRPYTHKSCGRKKEYFENSYFVRGSASDEATTNRSLFHLLVRRHLCYSKYLSLSLPHAFSLSLSPSLTLSFTNTSTFFLFLNLT